AGSAARSRASAATGSALAGCVPAGGAGSTLNSGSADSGGTSESGGRLGSGPRGVGAPRRCARRGAPALPAGRDGSGGAGGGGMGAEAAGASAAGGGSAGVGAAAGVAAEAGAWGETVSLDLAPARNSLLMSDSIETFSMLVRSVVGRDIVTELPSPAGGV